MLLELSTSLASGWLAWNLSIEISSRGNSQPIPIDCIIRISNSGAGENWTFKGLEVLTDTFEWWVRAIIQYHRRPGCRRSSLTPRGLLQMRMPKSIFGSINLRVESQAYVDNRSRNFSYPSFSLVANGAKQRALKKYFWESRRSFLILLPDYQKPEYVIVPRTDEVK